MRDLALKVISGGLHTAWAPIIPNSPHRVIPFDSELMGVVVHLSSPPTLAHSAHVQVQLYIGGTLTNYALGTYVKFPAGVTEGFFPPDKKLFIAAGSRIRLVGLGENAATDAYQMTCTYILKPRSPRPVGEMWLNGAVMANIETEDSQSNTICVPFACRVAGVSVSGNPTDAPVVLTLLRNYADTTAQVLLPSGHTHGYHALTKTVYLASGEHILMKSDGGGTTGGGTYFNYTLIPESNSVPVGWEYIEFQGMNFSNVANFQSITAPCHGRIRNLVTHWDQAINTTPDTGNTFNLKVNGSNPDGNPIYRNEETTQTHVGLSVPIENLHDVYVRQGNLVTVQSNGEQVADTPYGRGGIWIEPMGQSAFGGT